MLRLDEIREKLSDRNWKEVSRKSGVMYHIVLFVVRGQYKSVKAVDHERLSDYIEGK